MNRKRATAHKFSGNGELDIPPELLPAYYVNHEGPRRWAWRQLDRELTWLMARRAERERRRRRLMLGAIACFGVAIGVLLFMVLTW